MRRPSGVRIGMFWRFGSDDDRRPVEATAWWNVVCSRPSSAMSARQGLDVGRAQLRVDPPLEQLVDHRMGGAQVLEHGRIGRVAGLRPLALGQVELVEEDLFELLGAAQVELVPDVHVDLALQPVDLGGELAVQDAQRLEVEGDADGLHPGEDRDERQLDLAEQALQLDLVEAALERLADGQRGQRLEAGACRRRQLVGRRQDLVEVLRHDVGDGLAAQGGVEDVGRDLRVDGDRQGLASRSSANAATRTGLTSCPTSGTRSRSSRRRRAVAASGPSAATIRPSTPVTARASGVPRRGRGSSWTRAIPTCGWSASHGSRSAMRSGPWTSMRPGSWMAWASAVGRSSAGSKVRSVASPPAGPASVAVGRAGDGVEVEPELELAARRRGAADRSARAPAVGPPTGDARRGHVAALDDRPELRRAFLGALAGHRRQALDERPELVLAEQADDGVAVVVAETGRLEIEVDGQVAHDGRQVVAHPDLVDVLAQLVAELGRGHLVESGEQRVEVAELADELGRGLLADAGHARDVVGRVALERLVVDHLVRPQPEPLVDPVECRT